MKFQRTVAIALANKLHQKLVAARDQAVEDFTLPKQEQKVLEIAIDDYFKAVEKQREVSKYLKDLTNASYIQGTDSKESMLKSVIKLIALNKVKPIPRTEDLIDDFLIESLGAESAEELLAKVEAKYSME